VVLCSRALFGYEGQTNDLKVISKGGKAVILIGTSMQKFNFSSTGEVDVH
jgi:hypothetical protein